jgi:hypothetical protein
MQGHHLPLPDRLRLNAEPVRDIRDDAAALAQRDPRSRRLFGQGHHFQGCRYFPSLRLARFEGKAL